MAEQQEGAETDGMELSARSSDEPIWISVRNTLTDKAAGVDRQTFDTIQAAKLLSVMGNETRLQLLIALCEKERSVNELSDHLGLPPVRASHYLGQLRRGHVVRRRRCGQTVRYICDDESILRVLETLSHLEWR